MRASRTECSGGSWGLHCLLSSVPFVLHNKPVSASVSPVPSFELLEAEMGLWGLQGGRLRLGQQLGQEGGPPSPQLWGLRPTVAVMSEQDRARGHQESRECSEGETELTVTFIYMPCGLVAVYSLDFPSLKKWQCGNFRLIFFLRSESFSSEISSFILPVVALGSLP